jgi:hypothetical protein
VDREVLKGGMDSVFLRFPGCVPWMFRYAALFLVAKVKKA